MKLIKSLLVIGVITLGFLITSASAQMSGTTYKIPASSYIGGGGTGASTSYALTGMVPLSGAGVFSSTNYTATGGTTGIIYGGMTTLSTSYDGNPVAIVPKENRTLKVAYSGSSGTATGIIYYRQGGQASYQSAAMTPGTGDTLIYNLSASQLTIRGLEYYLEVTRGIYLSRIGVPTGPLIFRTALTNEQAQKPSATPQNQYRIVGMPLDITGSNTVPSVFEDDLGTYNTSQWRVGRYNTASGDVREFDDADAVQPGRGYWLITREPATYGAPGNSVRPSRSIAVPGAVLYYEVPLAEGWNQLANPFGFNVAWDDILFDVGGTIVDEHPAATLEDSAYSYNGSGYVTYNAIPAWEGVFVLINQANVKALVPYRESSVTPKIIPPKEKPSFSASSWNLEISLEAGEYIDAGNFLGVRTDALKGPDQYDFSEPPAAPLGPRLGFRIPDDDSRLRRSDYRPPITDGETWEIEVTKSPDRKIAIVGLDHIPSDLEAWIITDDGQKFNLADDDMIDLPDRVSMIRLIIGSSRYASDEIASLLPIDFELQQNFPNPFNPFTTIRFALPKANHTRLEIYNVLGQKVRTLVDADFPAGYHTVQWDATDNQGNITASGVYFYRLVSGENSAYRKMLLVK